MASASTITDKLEQQRRRQQLQSPPTLKCPRCDSSNTKFCYYNNYSLSQPRHFCKACKRYWTRGGTLRNVPVGGACRKNKRHKTSSSSIASTPSQNPSLLNSINSTFPMIFGVHSPNPSDSLGFSSSALFQSHISDLREGFDSAKQIKGILHDSNHVFHPMISFDRISQLSDNFETSFATPRKEVKMDDMNRLEQIDMSNFSIPSHYWNSGTTEMGNWPDSTNTGSQCRISRVFALY